MFTLPSVAETDTKIKIVESEGKKKAILKGGRLGMYPSGFRIWRTSRGIKKPISENMNKNDAERKVKGLKCVYERCIEIIDEEKGYKNTIHTRQYNKLKKG